MRSLAPPPNQQAMDARAALHHRLLMLVPKSEHQRFTRALAALEAHTTNEIHLQTRRAHEAALAGDAAVADAEGLVWPILLGPAVP